MSSTIFESIADDWALLTEHGSAEPRGLERAELESHNQSGGLVERLRVEEAIVRRFGRPSLLVRNGSFGQATSPFWKRELERARRALEAALPSVGRVELSGFDHDWIGTGWVVAPGVVVTNRHVASVFSERSGSGFRFRRDRHDPQQRMRVRIDFREEHRGAGRFEVEIEEVIHVTRNRDAEPDLAFLRLSGDAARRLPPPIRLARSAPQERQLIATVGYPAFDRRNDRDDQARLFEHIYEVKRLAPGKVMRVSASHWFAHDCTTLGGVSGGVILDMASGEAIGLHFGGRYERANYAVKAEVVRDHLDRLGIQFDEDVGAGGIGGSCPGSQRRHDDGHGYDSQFLGKGRLEVPLPELSRALLRQVARQRQAGRADRPDYVLDYTHFSVVVNAERRLAQFTAVNIDGGLAKKVKRGRDRWRFDDRIAEQDQVGNELYRRNPIDRGHLVRRLDPAWGRDAKQAEEDTFHWTNAAPQHKDLNQKVWLALEDYLLGSSKTHGFKASVFTGPVFAADDRRYREVQIPAEFWKVAVMIGEDGRRLSATAYLLSQKGLLRRVGREFVFGRFRTYQVPITSVEELTGLNFGRLRDCDPLVEERATGAWRELAQIEDIRL